MPDDTPVATPAPDTKTDSFDLWRSNRGSEEPAPVDVKAAEPAKDPASASLEPSPDSDPADKQSKSEKRKANIQREIDDLVKQRETLRRESSSPTQSTAAPNTPAPAAAAPVEDPKDPKPVRPVQKTFQIWEDYDTAMEEWREKNTAWVVRQEHRALQAKQASETAKEENERSHREALATFKTRGDEYAAKNPEYIELVKDFSNKNVTNEVAACILEADNGPEILHYLMENPDELKAIESSKLPIKRLDAIYALKYKLLGFGAESTAGTSSATEKPKSAAPAPGTRVRGTGGGSPQADPTSYQAYLKKRAG